MNTRIEPIELTDDELKAVAGGGDITLGNQNNVSNSFNIAGIDVNNSVNNNNNSFN
jgi:hypothetical protein